MEREKEYNTEDEIILTSGATPMAVADAIIMQRCDEKWLECVINYLRTMADSIRMQCYDKKWLEDVISYLEIYVEKEYMTLQTGSEEKTC